MNRPIDADALKNRLTALVRGGTNLNYCIADMIDRAPTMVEFDGEITKVIVRGKEYINPECGAETKGKVDGRDDTGTEQPDH